MIVNVADLINSILQCIMFVVTINYCLEKEYKKTTIQLIIYIIISWIAAMISYKLIENSSLNFFITHIISLGVLCLLFKKDYLGLFVSHTVIYFAIIINLIMGSNVILEFIYPRINGRYMDIYILFFIYLPQMIMALVIFKKLDQIKKIYKIIRAKKITTISFFILSLTVDFLLAFNLIIYGDESSVPINIIFMLLLILLIFITINFAINEKKVKEINKLNIELEERIFELKKIKHDYGSQISYLYALHLMKNYNKLGKLLKDVIEKHNNVFTEIQISNKDDSIIANIIKGITTKNVNIIVDEQAKIQEFPLKEVELQQVITNIVSNSVTAMNGRGRIIIRTLYEFNKIVIIIENNGSQIDKSIINNIFEEGLTIVKDIVSKYSGKIELFSDVNKTEFKIILPLE